MTRRLLHRPGDAPGGVRTKGVVGFVVVSVVASFAGLGGVAHGAAPASMAAVVKAAGSRQSVHYVSTGDYGGLQVTQVADVGVRSGIQRITVKDGASSGSVTVIVSGGNAYVRGSDVFVLVAYMGFDPAAAPKYAGRWVSIPPDDLDYSTVSAAVTLPSTIQEIALSKPVAQSSTTTKDGRQVNAFRGKTPKTLGQQFDATLYASAKGAPLPVQEVVHQGAVENTLIFSKWNEPVASDAAVPAGSIPISRTGLEPAGQIA